MGHPSWTYFCILLMTCFNWTDGGNLNEYLSLIEQQPFKRKNRPILLFRSPTIKRFKYFIQILEYNNTKSSIITSLFPELIMVSWTWPNKFEEIFHPSTKKYNLTKINLDQNNVVSSIVCIFLLKFVSNIVSFLTHETIPILTYLTWVYNCLIWTKNTPNRRIATKQLKDRLRTKTRFHPKQSQLLANIFKWS